MQLVVSSFALGSGRGGDGLPAWKESLSMSQEVVWKTTVRQRSILWPDGVALQSKAGLRTQFESLMSLIMHMYLWPLKQQSFEHPRRLKDTWS